MGKDDLHLLVITNNPERASYRQRIGVYVDMLAEDGIAAETAVLPAGIMARRRLFGHAARFDGVLLHKKTLNLFDASCLRRRARKIIFNFDDAIMFSDRRPDCYSRSHFAPFRRTVMRADMVLVGSRYLAGQAAPFNSNIRVLPLGLDIRDYGSDCPRPDDGKVRLVWIGSKSTLGYLSGIRPVLETLASRFRNVVLRVIGDEFPTWPGICVEGIPWSLQSRRVGLATADVGLAPLPDNPFTRGKCSFKVLEYSASGLPVVASPVGTNVDYVQDGVTGFHAADLQAWTHAIAELIDHPERRRHMGQAGRKLAEGFDVSIVGRRLSKILAECMRQK